MEKQMEMEGWHDRFKSVEHSFGQGVLELVVARGHLVEELRQPGVGGVHPTVAARLSPQVRDVVEVGGPDS
jgi:hypothetical protein